jgi:hypothetical protein
VLLQLQIFVSVAVQIPSLVKLCCHARRVITYQHCTTAAAAAVSAVSHTPATHNLVNTAILLLLLLLL